MALTKVQIIDSIRDQVGVPRKRAAELLEVLLEIIKQGLQNGEEVLISGFGKFCVKEKRERKGRNPATGEKMMLDKRKVVTFRCSSVLRENMNKVSEE